jgi:hypothetical protein
MKTKTIKIYNYSELSDQAQENAFSKWLEHSEFLWHSDYRNSLKSFTRNFDCIRLVDWNVSENDYNFRLYDTELSYDNYYVNSDKKTLLEIANSNEYNLTGFSADFLFHDVIKKEKENILKMNKDDLIEFFRDIYRNFFSGWSSDIAHSFSLEYFEENDANENEYLENGEIA